MAQLPRPIPFVGVPRQRDVGSEDERYVNFLFERIANDPLREHSINCVKRFGEENFSQPSGGAATGRGAHAWYATGKIYSVFGNRLYADTSAIGATLNSSSGMVSFLETPQSGSELLIVSDGLDHYNVNTVDGVVTIDESDDSHFPTPSLADIGYIDGYLVKAQSNGRLWNFDLGSYTSIGSASFLSVDTFAGDLVGFRIQKDQIIALTQNRGEFFFNNGNPSGSPFLRIDQNTLGVGCAARQSIACSGELMFFVGENSSDGGGGRAVWQISSLGKVNDISTPVINRFLDSEGTSISTCTSWAERIDGKLLYFLNLDSAERTFVYNVDLGLWSEASDTSGNKFNIVSVTSLNGTIYGQDASNGRIYKLLPTVFQDSGSNFTCTIQTSRNGFGAPHMRKAEDSLSIMGDTTTGNLVVSVSDNDYASFSATRNIDMSRKQKIIYRMGGRFYERAHKFTYSDNYALRLQAWIPQISL